MRIIILALLFTLTSCLSGIGQQRKTNKTIQQDTVTHQERAPTYDEIMEFRNSLEYQALLDSSLVVVKSFLKLYEEKRFQEALELYFNDKESFMVALTTTEEKYNFHQDYIIPLIEFLKDEDEASTLIIEIMEYSLFEADVVIDISGWRVIPNHYEHLLSSLGQLYLNEGQFDKSIAICDKLLEYFNRISETDSFDFGLINYNKGFVYYLMKEYQSAVKCLKESKEIFEKCEMRDSQTYKDCHNLLDEIEALMK